MSWWAVSKGAVVSSQYLQGRHKNLCFSGQACRIDLPCHSMLACNFYAWSPPVSKCCEPLTFEWCERSCIGIIQSPTLLMDSRSLAPWGYLRKKAHLGFCSKYTCTEKAATPGTLKPGMYPLHACSVNLASGLVQNSFSV